MIPDPVPPHDWEPVARDEAERLLRRFTDTIRSSFLELEVGQGMADRSFNWQSAKAQEWILGRIAARLFHY